MSKLTLLEQGRGFVDRHIGPSTTDTAAMLQEIGLSDIDQLINETVPKTIRLKNPLELPSPLSEHAALAKLKQLAQKNKVFRSYLGMGYHDTLVPPVIQRNILENPGWYTQYTPYQAEISQGRLEALLNFQTMIADLTGLKVANASLLDEATAAAEAMGLCYASRKAGTSAVYFVAQDCHPQTIAVVKTRAEALGIEIAVGDPAKIAFDDAPFGILLQYPTSLGNIPNYEALISKAQAAGSIVTMATDLLSLALLKPPGELGADIAVGSSQRFGVPLGYGGPHAAFFATKDEFKRKIPGRIIGVSKDANGKAALRMALQTREQHIRRDKATSNICTAQVLLAIMASMYAVYHGPTGLRQIATRVHGLTRLLALGLEKLGYKLQSQTYFDTLTIATGPKNADALLQTAYAKQINLRKIDAETISIALDETTEIKDIEELWEVFAAKEHALNLDELASRLTSAVPVALQRQSPYLSHPVFNSYHSETQMMRYIKQLESRDLSLTRSMIPLGSCTMKLNATAELIPITWPEFGRIHPFAPQEQAQGYHEMFHALESYLAECTGFAAVSLQPNSGAQGEYAGLLVIKKYHQGRGDTHRNICLIPKSAHGTNPASAVMAGMKVVVVDCDGDGNISVPDLAAKAAEHGQNLSCLMVTYPSTHGVFEEGIKEICEVIHKHGGQVYMDGANMNAQVGLCRPGDFGPDVCHLNLHKTFCIPHGGGGPGMGPIGVAKHLAPHLPGHPVVGLGGDQACGPVSAAPYGSASILPISLMYIWMMGEAGLTKATKLAILNANYLAKKLDPHFPVLYRGKAGRVAHECIVDLRPLKARAGIEVEDVAKRLMDYGFHAPTVSFPVAGTLMIEPTESEAKDELDRFVEAMTAIRQEIRAIEQGTMDRTNNPLKNAPHTADVLVEESWNLPYSRQEAVFPLSWIKAGKFWPAVARVDGAYGDRNLVCTCEPIESYQ